MATGIGVERLVRAGKGKKGPWEVTRNEPEGTHSLLHYGTTMLVWNAKGDMLYTSIGRGSMSDQTGMNAAFRALEIPYRFDRAGGAHFTRLNAPQHPSVPF